MGEVQSTDYCQVCGRQTMFVKPRVNHILHLILSVLTAGLWALFVWLPVGVLNSGKRPRCTVCGTLKGTRLEQVHGLVVQR